MQNTFCGHPLPWHSWWNGFAYFVFDADQEVVMTNDNKELVEAVVKLSEKREKGEFTGE